MSCGKPYCTCCETSYVAGLADGFKSGFETGFKRGHRNGYVNGYLDRHNGYQPLSDYKVDVERALPAYDPPKLPGPLELSCGCYVTCTCRSLLPNPIPTYQPPKPPVLRLSCGCFGACTCPPKIPDYANNLLGAARECTCVGICVCGNRY